MSRRSMRYAWRSWSLAPDGRRNVSIEREATLLAALDELGLSGSRLESSDSRATDTLVWRVKYQGQSLAIRVLREEQRPVMDLERQVMVLARENDIPVPAIIATGYVHGRRPAMAIEWVSGESAGDIMLAHPKLAHRLGTASGKILARIHQIPLPEQLPNSHWPQRGTQRDPELRELLHQATRRPPSLLHLDFHPFNLIATGGRITGVLDWTNAAFGDPRADIARTVSIMRLVAPALIGTIGARRMSLGMFTRGLLSSYQRWHGELTGMAPFYVWAGQFMLDDLGPKIASLPVSSPAAIRRNIEEWVRTWRARAFRS